MLWLSNMQSPYEINTSQEFGLKIFTRTFSVLCFFVFLLCYLLRCTFGHCEEKIDSNCFK